MKTTSVNTDKASQLDQFYTSPSLAEYFLSQVKSTLDYDSYDLVLEPSAGTGSFYNLLDSRRVGIDLDPKCPGVESGDFFDYTPPIPYGSILTIGNPPFGKNSSLAVKFFNHAARFSQAIAFVIPRTFRKASLINRLDANFTCVYDETVPDNSFIFDDKPYDVWCAMQIWTRQSTKRPKLETLSLEDAKDYWVITTPELADFCVQRVGGRAGQVRTEDFRHYSTQSHYYIKSLNDQTIDIFKSLDYSNIKHNTAGNPSISPSELTNLFLTEARKRNI